MNEKTTAWQMPMRIKRDEVREGKKATVQESTLGTGGGKEPICKKGE